MTDEPRGQRIEQLVEGEPEVPIEAPRTSYAAPVEEMWKESARYTGVRLRVEPSLVEDHEWPGQYVTMAPPSIEPRFLVIASAPDVGSADTWEFLIDRRTSLGEAFESVQPGSTLEITPPEGPGYPVDEVETRRVLCFATGSGIASIRPAVQYWLAHPDEAPEQLTIYYGESRPGDFVYREEIQSWSREGVRVYECCESTHGGSTERFEYVQHAFAHDDPDLRETTVFLSGAPVMKRAVVERLLDRDLPLEDVVTNI